MHMQIIILFCAYIRPLSQLDQSKFYNIAISILSGVISKSVYSCIVHGATVLRKDGTTYYC